MNVFIAYIIGFIVTTVTLGVLYKKGINNWDPMGNISDQPPHILVAIMWPFAISMGILFCIGWSVYTGLDRLSSYIASIKFSITK